MRTNSFTPFNYTHIKKTTLVQTPIKPSLAHRAAIYGCPLETPNLSLFAIHFNFPTKQIFNSLYYNKFISFLCYTEVEVSRLLEYPLKLRLQVPEPSQ